MFPHTNCKFPLILLENCSSGYATLWSCPPPLASPLSEARYSLGPTQPTLSPGSSAGIRKIFIFSDNTRCRDTRDQWFVLHHDQIVFIIPCTRITKTKWLKPNLHIVNRHTRVRDMRKADRWDWDQVRPVLGHVISWAVLSMSVIRSQPSHILYRHIHKYL